jgi:hypothetical protein
VLLWDSLPLQLAVFAAVMLLPLLGRLFWRFLPARLDALRWLVRTRWTRVGGHVIWLLLVIEASVRVLVAYPPLFLRMQVFTEAYNRLQWVQQKYNEKHREQVILFPHDRDLGWLPGRSIDHLPTPTGKFICTNSRGLRGPTEHRYEKLPGTCRIAVMGDSYTFGMEENDDETWPAKLQEALPRCEVINFGVSGYGPDQEIMYFRKEAYKYHPDIVLMGFLSMDAMRSEDGFSFGAKPYYAVEADGSLILRGWPVKTPEEIVDDELYRCRTLEFLEIFSALARKGRHGNDDRTVTIPLLTGLFGEFSRVVRTSGATPVFVYLPNCNEMEGSGPPSYEAFATEYCAGHKELLVNTHTPLDALMKKGVVRRVWRAPHHYMGSESAVIARTVADALARQGLVPAGQGPVAVSTLGSDQLGGVHDGPDHDGMLGPGSDQVGAP